MSKERELLEETLVVLEMVNMDECDLYFAIEELLAQPEPEQSSKWWYGKGVEDTKYFLKREPLSDDVIRKFADAEYMVCNNAFTQGIRFAEKHHNIGGDGM